MALITPLLTVRQIEMAGAHASGADATPGIYLVEQTFQIPETEELRTRKGFLARLEVEAFGQNIFRFALAEPDRGRNSDVKPLLIFHDGEIAWPELPGAPVSNVRKENGVETKLWAVTDEAAIERVLLQVRNKKLVVGDGVARYEDALEQGEQWLPAVFVSWEDAGLVALPQHRVVQDKADYSTGVLVMNSRAYFFFEEVSHRMPALHVGGPRFEAGKARELLTPVAASETAAAKSAEEAGARVSPGAARNSLVEDGDIAMLAVTRKQTFRMHSKPGWANSILAHVAEAERDVDVTQLHRIILEGVLELPESAIREGKYISYHRSSEEAVRRVQGGANVAFILSTPRLDRLREVALSGGVLPQNAVEFYPPIDGSEIDLLD